VDGRKLRYSNGSQPSGVSNRLRLAEARCQLATQAVDDLGGAIASETEYNCESSQVAENVTIEDIFAQTHTDPPRSSAWLETTVPPAQSTENVSDLLTAPWSPDSPTPATADLLGSGSLVAWLSDSVNELLSETAPLVPFWERRATGLVPNVPPNSLGDSTARMSYFPAQPCGPADINFVFSPPSLLAGSPHAKSRVDQNNVETSVKRIKWFRPHGWTALVPGESLTLRAQG
jgi:hypothetical protein